MSVVNIHRCMHWLHEFPPSYGDILDYSKNWSYSNLNMGTALLIHGTLSTAKAVCPICSFHPSSLRVEYVFWDDRVRSFCQRAASVDACVPETDVIEIVSKI